MQAGKWKNTIAPFFMFEGGRSFKRTYVGFNRNLVSVG